MVAEPAEPPRLAGYQRSKARRAGARDQKCRVEQNWTAFNRQLARRSASCKPRTSLQSIVQVGDGLARVLGELHGGIALRFFLREIAQARLRGNASARRFSGRTKTGPIKRHADAPFNVVRHALHNRIDAPPVAADLFE